LIKVVYKDKRKASSFEARRFSTAEARTTSNRWLARKG